VYTPACALPSARMGPTLPTPAPAGARARHAAASGTAQSTPRSPGTFLRAWARLDWLVVALVVTTMVAGLILAVRR
jgi:hypothetical protein